jgi:hypothetical protein
MNIEERKNLHQFSAISLFFLISQRSGFATPFVGVVEMIAAWVFLH